MPRNFVKSFHLILFNPFSQNGIPLACLLRFSCSWQLKRRQPYRMEYFPRDTILKIDINQEKPFNKRKIFILFGYIISAI